MFSALPAEPQPTTANPSGGIAMETGSGRARVNSPIPVPTQADEGGELVSSDSSQSSLGDYVHLSSVITLGTNERGCEDGGTSEETKPSRESETLNDTVIPADSPSPRDMHVSDHTAQNDESIHGNDTSEGIDGNDTEGDYVHLSSVITLGTNERGCEDGGTSEETKQSQEPETLNDAVIPADSPAPRDMHVSDHTAQNDESIHGTDTEGGDATMATGAVSTAAVAGSADFGIEEPMTVRDMEQNSSQPEQVSDSVDSPSSPVSCRSPSREVTGYPQRPPSIREEEEGEEEEREAGDEERTITAETAAQLRKGNPLAASQERVLLATVEVSPHITPSPFSTPERALSPHSDVGGQSDSDSSHRDRGLRRSRERMLSPPRRGGGSSELDYSNLDTGGRRHRRVQHVSSSPPEVRRSPMETTAGLPVLEPLSPTHSTDGLDQQYEYLRRTLSHSRRRYSTRRSRNPASRSERSSPAAGVVSRHTMREGAGRYRGEGRGNLRDMLTSTEIPRSNSGRV